jgi:HsdM N-terminal domain
VGCRLLHPGAQDAPNFKEFILPLIFAKRLCDLFDDEIDRIAIDRIAKEVGSRAKAFRLVKHDKKLVRFHLPLQPSNPDDSVWSVIRTLSDKSANNSRLPSERSPTPTRFSRGSSTAWISTLPRMVSAISPMTDSLIS